MTNEPEKRGPAAAIPEHVEQMQHLTEDTARRLIKLVEGSQPVRRLRASQLASAFVGAVGVALFIGGVEEAARDIPIISNAYGAIAVGILLLALTGVLLERLSKVRE